MTAVVGPNGCGKSNISDALAWVLGEQRATLLRGNEMSDVIFAGTSQRKPMGLSEVKLTLEMADPALPGAVKEVVISRRLYRDTGGEYRINGRETRLKDIQDLLMDTGMGTRAYSFIQQGQIDLILSTKPKDRRSLLEEAAGITRYKLRRADAERRLEDTRSNLQRLDDILHELGKQQDSLKRQAAKARRAQELDTAIKATQRILLAGKAMELEAAKERILEQLDSLERQIAALTAQASEKASEVEQQRHGLDELNHAQDKRSRAILALDQRLSLADQDRGFQEERIREAREQHEVLKLRLEELSSRSGDSEAEAARLQAALQVAEKALEARESFVSESDEAVALAAGSLRHIETELKELRARRAEAERAAIAIQRQRQVLHQQVAQAEGRLDALNHEESVRSPRLEGLQAEDLRLAREFEGAEARAEQVEEAVQVQVRLQAEALEAHRAAAATLREAEGALDAEERRLKQLADALRQASGSEEVQKALAWLKAQGEDPFSLPEALSVDDETLADVERILGPWLESLSLGEASLKSLGEAPGRLLVAVGGAAEAPAAPMGCEPLSPHLRWRTGKARPLEALLVRTFRCSDAALPELAASHPGLGFVSPGLVRLPFGPIQVGVHAPAISPLKLRNDLEACRNSREELLDRVEALEAELKARQARLQEASERAREMEEDRVSSRRALEDLKGRHASVRGQLREIQEAQERADLQWEQLEAEIATLRAQLRDLEAPEENPETSVITEAIHAAEGRQQDAQAELERRRQVLMEATQIRASVWAERDSLQRQVLQLQRGAYDLEAEKKRVQEDIRQTEQRGEQAQLRIRKKKPKRAFRNGRPWWISRPRRSPSSSALPRSFASTSAWLASCNRPSRMRASCIRNP
jgi:chromosome segregation protein